MWKLWKVHNKIPGKAVAVLWDIHQYLQSPSPSPSSVSVKRKPRRGRYRYIITRIVAEDNSTLCCCVGIEWKKEFERAWIRFMIVPRIQSTRIIHLPLGIHRNVHRGNLELLALWLTCANRGAAVRHPFLLIHVTYPSQRHQRHNIHPASGWGWTIGRGWKGIVVPPALYSSSLCSVSVLCPFTVRIIFLQRHQVLSWRTAIKRKRRIVIPSQILHFRHICLGIGVKWIAATL